MKSPLLTPVLPGGAVRPAAADDDQYVGYLGTDEDAWLPPVPLVLATVRPVLDDEQYVGTCTVDDDGQWRFVRHHPGVGP